MLLLSSDLKIKARNTKYDKICKQLAKKEKGQNKSGVAKANDAYTNLKTNEKNPSTKNWN